MSKKRGRGRPTKAELERAQASLPLGRRRQLAGPPEGQAELPLEFSRDTKVTERDQALEVMQIMTRRVQRKKRKRGGDCIRSTRWRGRRRRREREKQLTKLRTENRC